LKAAYDEVQTLRLRDTEITNKLSDRVTELERANDDLRGQLASAANIDGSAQDKVDSLASTIETLTKEKFQLESRLTKEIQKSTKRRDEAKERRQKFKGKLAGMAETLNDGERINM
jgi:predicted  nucleic acid-binding Zn-ribbon protein